MPLDIDFLDSIRYFSKLSLDLLRCIATKKNIFVKQVKTRRVKELTEQFC